MKGYPASALALIARLVERAGNDARSGGAITAVLTVLADGDDVVADPVVDAARGVLDGHIVLDRGIAGRGRFPAIDLGHSLSRTMSACVPPEVVAAAANLRRDCAQLDANRDLVAMGAYAPGQNPALDLALSREVRMETFLAQPRAEVADFDASLGALMEGWSE
jgi:flagellum-specific ATP synthase